MGHHCYNDHHIVPSSRGGQETIQLPKKFHDAWHTLFQNMYDEEILVFIQAVQEMFDEYDNKITAKELHDLRKRIKRGDYNG